METLSAWTRDSENKIYFLEKVDKYAVFKNPQVTLFLYLKCVTQIVFSGADMEHVRTENYVLHALWHEWSLTLNKNETTTESLGVCGEEPLPLHRPPSKLLQTAPPCPLIWSPEWCFRCPAVVAYGKSRRVIQNLPREEHFLTIKNVHFSAIKPDRAYSFWYTRWQQVMTNTATMSNSLYN